MTTTEARWGKYTPDKRYWLIATGYDGTEIRSTEPYPGNEIEARVTYAVLLGSRSIATVRVEEDKGETNQ